MAATLEPISTRSPLPTPAPPSASPSTTPAHAYPSPAAPAPAPGEPSASEDEARRGRSKLPVSGPALADHSRACADHASASASARPSRPRPPSIVKPRARDPSGSKARAGEGVQRLTAAEMQELTSSPDSLPVAPAPDRRHSVDQGRTAGPAAQGERPGRRPRNRSPDMRRLERIHTGVLAAGCSSGPAAPGPWTDARPRRCAPRTASTPPPTRSSRYATAAPKPAFSRSYSYHISPRSPFPPSGSDLAGDVLNGYPPSSADRIGPAAESVRPNPAAEASHDCPGPVLPAESFRQNPAANASHDYPGPSPPSPIPSMIPLPPMSLPTHLQLELASQRPSPLYIHQSRSNDVPYESYAVKLERLKNVLLVPPYLERTLYFGALACLDAWLHTFTILPIRFILALGILLQWWGYLVTKEVTWLCGFVRHGLGRLWKRGRANHPRRRSDASANDAPRTSSRAREPSAAAAAKLRERPRHTRMQRHAEDAGLPPPHRTRQPGPQTGGVFRHRRAKSLPSALSPFHKADLLQGAVIVCSSVALMTLDASRMYHFIRAQSAIKLYVIYNILEVGDRLLSALGQDILECLFSSETLSRDAAGRSKVLLPLGMFALALAYNCLHSVTLYYQVITLNVAVNSYSNALFTLLLSNQFVEIKSTVFKRFDKDALFQLTCADVVERFHLWVMLLIIGMRNLVEVGAFSVPGAGFDSSSHEDGAPAVPLHSPSILPHSFTALPAWMRSGEALSPFLIVVGSEMLVDTVKHAYVSKFNNLKPTFYGRTLDILCKDYYTNAFAMPSLTKRLGLAVIPLSCLFIRASIQTYHMFLSTHVPMPPPPSTQTSLSDASAVPSSPAMIVALGRFDALLRDSLGRATYGYPYGSPLNSRPWYAWTADDLIAALTMVVVFFIIFLLLLIVKLLLGMALLQYARNRYARMKQHERLVALGRGAREGYDASGRRVGGRGDVEVTDDKARWIRADASEGLGSVGGDEAARAGKRPVEGEYMGVARYDMVGKRIW
ncbi:hypothetical protein UVI_02047080 [Ustilaginoidea virens]|uniref:Cytomegalovirus gH-receptor family protein n=1 Tax=Ustilaginoidea virens TaxID=1159556 RepID=A0A1B5L697_USTVR|nr:hypothetical protein UVI_02047080 [Ustilaginoidea virens]